MRDYGYREEVPCDRAPCSFAARRWHSNGPGVGGTVTAIAAGRASPHGAARTSTAARYLPPLSGAGSAPDGPGGSRCGSVRAWIAMITGTSTAATMPAAKPLL